ncbi:MAG: phosphoribosylformylglycinamidine cyclo-ligase [Treponema sp.]|jgi:phosphoribosylformylglycinamidine cyclo-ligase|nr:phosphoribosylformylglycinamidine cyclo-ligase [Treponema sp.]
MDYNEAGVNIQEGYRAVEKYRELTAGSLGSLGKAVIGGIGGFAGMFSLKDLTGSQMADDPAATGLSAGKSMEEPVLVSGADGVGTKLDIAFRMKKYDTVGIDCVAMCVNDILCHGARPLFFLDYLACGKLDAATAAALVGGAAAGCREADCVLLGGETAEMPGFYEEGKYDMAGFALGIVDRKNIIGGGKIREGDALVGIASSGPHSNGFSLIRRILPDLEESFGGMPLGRALLEPTRIYVKPILDLMKRVPLHGMAHITGGGFYENIPRMFPFVSSPTVEQGEDVPGESSAASPNNSTGTRRFDALIRNTAWKIPAIFNRIASGTADPEQPGAMAEHSGEKLLQRDESLRRLMFNTFNMGIGFVMALETSHVKEAVDYLDSRGFPSWEIGKVSAGSGKVHFT